MTAPPDFENQARNIANVYLAKTDGIHVIEAMLRSAYAAGIEAGRAAEREEAARVCVDMAEEDWRGASRAGVLRTAANAIRARANKGDDRG